MNIQRAFALLILAAWFVSTASAQIPAPSCDQEKSFGREDKSLFARHCGLCHSLSGVWKRVGPPLSGLFERKQLINGQPVTEENVRDLIGKGGPGLMPGFQHMLTRDQIGDLVRYLKESRCSAGAASK